MWRATPELVRALRQRYEDTDQLISSIAAEFGLGERTLGRMAKTEGWRKRSGRLQGLPKAVQLLAQAEALAGKTREELGPRSLHETRSALLRGDERGESPPPAGGVAQTSAIDRLEALVVQEIAAAEQARAQVTDKRQLAKTSEKAARNLATLSQTLRTLQQMRTGKPLEPEMNDDDDMPRDLDEFRHALARRIEALFEGEADAGDADAHSESANVEAS